MRNKPNRLDPRRPARLTEALGTKLRRLVVGQDEAIQKIVDLYQMYVTGMTSPGRPIGNILFMGPTGSGKTRLVEATAESLFGDATAIVKINCAEYQHSHGLPADRVAARIPWPSRDAPIPEPGKTRSISHRDTEAQLGAIR